MVSQYLSVLARDLQSDVICDTHVEMFGDPRVRQSRFSLNMTHGERVLLFLTTSAPTFMCQPSVRTA
jgi:hypothetical protein